MFIGEYRHNIDAKGRLILPAKFRSCLGERCIATRGLDHCLFVFPLEEWQGMEEKMKNLPLTKKEARAFSRFFFSGATECELDGQGRILLPPSLREYAQISKEVAVIGVSSRIEIWAAERWDEYCAGAEETYEELAEKMDLGGVFID
ncbi:MAG: division/cell wall cluster transcriptional repressor MraZ [Thermacetogeniaceae bacterium]|jgi:MraZ protein|nr:cell division/cell wall cluster transcriptional repressor MraZ [Peptococcaceae bacterium]